MRWVIGDIHGMFRPLQVLLTAVTSFDRNAHFIFAGDYINRGPQSREVIALLLTLPSAQFVRGNHDDVFDFIVNGASYCDYPFATRQEAVAAYLECGLDQTFASYGVGPAEIDRAIGSSQPDAVEGLAKAIPQGHRNFFRVLDPVVEYDDVFIAHAMWRCDEPDRMALSPGLEERARRDDALRHRLLWGRFREAEIRCRKPWQRTGYFGHTPVLKLRGSRGIGNVPLRGPRIVLVDTGAALGPQGRLSAVCIEDGSFLQADPDGKIVGSE